MRRNLEKLMDLMSQPLKTITDYYDESLHGMKGICETCLTFSIVQTGLE